MENNSSRNLSDFYDSLEELDKTLIFPISTIKKCEDTSKFQNLTDLISQFN